MRRIDCSIRLLDSSSPSTVAPVVRPASLVRHSENQRGIAVDLVDEVVGELREDELPDAGVDLHRCVRTVEDSPVSSLKLVEKHRT